MNFVNKLKTDIEQHSQRYLWVSIAVFVLFFIALAAKRYYYFDYNNADLSIFSQTLFNTIHGRWFEETLTINNYFADHFSPILVFLLPFYAVKPAPFTLLVLQIIITALSVWPIYKLAKNNTGNNSFAYLASLLWLINPFVHRQVMYEFHTLHIMLFLFFWAFYFYQRKKIKLLALFTFLALLVREDVALVFFGLALFDFVDKKTVRRPVGIFLCSLVYFILAISIIKQFSPSDNYKFVAYYNWAGGENFLGIIWSWLTHPVKVLIHLLSMKSIFILSYLLLTFLFIPIFSKKYLLIAIFPILQYAMTANGISGTQLYMHYVSLLLPGFFLAYIFGLWSIMQSENNKKLIFIHENKQFFIILFIFSCLFSLFFISPVTKIISKKYSPNYHQNRQAVINIIPKNASVAANPPLLTRLSSRPELYDLNFSYYAKTPFAERDFVLPSVDYIFIDMVDFMATINGRNAPSYWQRGDPLAMPDNWKKTLSDYNLVYARDEIYLWKNKKFNNNIRLPYFEYQPTDIDNNDFIKSWSLEQRDTQRVLKIVYNKLNSNSYLIRFYRGGDFWEMPFDYGLYSFSKNQADQDITVYYYLSEEVDSFGLYYYEGHNILGERGNIDFFFKRQSVFSKTKLD